MTSETYMPSPVCLIENINGQLEANQEALGILSNIKQPVVVVAIVGFYRTGKSYLMNKLAGKKSGFSLGSTVQSHTKGIWMWCLPHPQKEGSTLVLLDTEGLGDVEKGDNQNDCWIFALAVLLSSTFVYNSMGAINQQAMDRLHYVTELTDRIRTRSSPDQHEVDVSDEFVSFFPDFVWALRDFTLELKVDGKLISPDEYLEHSLRPIYGTGQTNKEKELNLPRLCIQKFFPKKKCFVFERPVYGRQLGKLESLQDEDIDPDFLEQLAEFCSYMLKCSKVKTLSGGIRVNGPRLESLVITYVNAISSGSQLCMENAVLALSQTENTAAVQKAIAHYVQQMSQKLQLPTETLQELTDVHRASEKEAIKIFMQNSFKDINQVFLTQLETSLEKKLEEFLKKNEQESSDRCLALLQDIFSPLEEDMKQGVYSKPGGYHLFMQKIQELKKKYYEEPKKGIQAEKILQIYLQSKEEVSNAILQTDQTLTKMEKEIEVEHMRAEATKAAAKMQEEMQQKYEQLMQEKERSHEKELKELTVKMKKEQAETRKIQQNYEQLLQQKKKSHQEHMKQLTEMLEKEQAEMKEMQQKSEQLLEVEEKSEEKEMKDMIEKMEKVQAEMKEMQHRYKQLLQEKEKSHEKDLKELTEKMMKEQAEMREMQQKKEHLMQEKEKSHEELMKQLSEKMENEQAQMREMQQDYEQLLQEKEKSHEKEMKELFEKMEKEQAETREMQQKYEELLQEKEKSHEKKMKYLSEKMENDQAQMREMQQDYKQLLQQKEKNHEKEMKDLTEMMEKEQAKVREMQEKYEQLLQQRKKSHQEHMKPLTEILQKEQDQNIEMQQKNEQLLQQKDKSHEKELKKLTEKEKKQAKMREMQQKYEQLLQEKEKSHEKEMKELIEKMEKEQAEIREMQQKYEELLQNKYKSHEKELKELTEKMEKEQAETREMQNYYEQFLQDKDKCHENGLKELTEKMEKEQAEIREMQEKYEELLQQKEKSHQEHTKQLTEMLETEQAKIREMQQKYEQLLQQKKKSIEEFMKYVIEMLEKHKIRLEAKLEEFFKKNAQVSSDHCSALLQGIFSPLEEDLKHGIYFKPGGYFIFMRKIRELKKKYYEEPRKGVQAEEVLQKFLQSKEEVSDAVLQTDQTLTEKEKETEVERVRAEATRAAARMQEEMQQKNKQLLQQKKSHEKHIKVLTEKMEEAQAQLREEQRAYWKISWVF